MSDSIDSGLGSDCAAVARFALGQFESQGVEAWIRTEAWHRGWDGGCLSSSILREGVVLRFPWQSLVHSLGSPHGLGIRVASRQHER